MIGQLSLTLKEEGALAGERGGEMVAAFYMLVFVVLVLVFVQLVGRGSHSIP